MESRVTEASTDVSHPPRTIERRQHSNPIDRHERRGPVSGAESDRCRQAGDAGCSIETGQVFRRRLVGDDDQPRIWTQLPHLVECPQ
jgi:hypothetical protein